MDIAIFCPKLVQGPICICEVEEPPLAVVALNEFTALPALAGWYPNDTHSTFLRFNRDPIGVTSADFNATEPFFTCTYYPEERGLKVYVSPEAIPDSIAEVRFRDQVLYSVYINHR